MKQLSENEQQYAYIAAVLATAVCVVFLVAAWDEKGALAIAGLGLVTTALLAAAAKKRNRLSTGVGAALLAFAPSPAWMVGLPYLMLFGWFTLRASRQRVLPEPEMDEHGEIVVRTPARPVREPRPPRMPRRRRSVKAEDDTAGGRKPPPPSKRYTPPQRPR